MDHDERLRNVEETFGRKLHALRGEVQTVTAAINLEINRSKNECVASHATNTQRLVQLERDTNKLWTNTETLQAWKNTHSTNDDLVEKDLREQCNDLCSRLTKVEEMMTKMTMSLGEGRMKVGVMWAIFGFLGSALGTVAVKLWVDSFLHAAQALPIK